VIRTREDVEIALIATFIRIFLRASLTRHAFQLPRSALPDTVEHGCRRNSGIPFIGYACKKIAD
jgi:hypothetical protein